MNETQTRGEYIDPALKAAGWGVVEGSKILREYLTQPCAPRLPQWTINSRRRASRSDA